MPTDDETGTDNATASRAAGRRRAKATGFPVVALDEAARILKEAGKYGFEHSTASFASYMGHSTTNSGAFRIRLAAFRDWKLITGRGATVALTDIARIIAHPTDDAAEKRALLAAFRNCEVFWKLYEGSAKDQPLTEGPLGTRAVHDFGVAPGSKAKFVQSFVDSATAAGVAKLTDDGKVLLFPVETEAVAEVYPPGTTTYPDGSGLQKPTHRRQPPPAGSTPVVYQVWTIDGGEIVFEIRCNQALRANAFVTVGEVVASLERLAATLSTQDADAEPVEA